MMQISAVEIPAVLEDSLYWLASLTVQEGQSVQQGQILARLEGKKEHLDLTSPQSGYVVGLHARPGQIVSPDQVLCYISSRPSIPTIQPSPHLSPFHSAALDPNALIIFGGGGHGKMIIELVRAAATYRIIGIVDDGMPVGSEILGVPVLGGAKALPEWYDRGVRLAANAVGGIGNAAVRVKIFDILAKAGFSCPTLVHPTAFVEQSAMLEAGVQVFPQAYVGSSVRIGFGSVISLGAIVAHDCVLGKVVNLSPAATLAGSVHIGDYAQLGMHATVNMQITIGAGARLGNNCTVKADVPPEMRVRAGTIWPIPNAVPANDFK
jgi:sugar O-acyltransferase (sialic acid O-acetyltransferase NeuD family)